MADATAFLIAHGAGRDAGASPCLYGSLTCRRGLLYSNMARGVGGAGKAYADSHVKDRLHDSVLFV